MRSNGQKNFDRCASKNLDAKTMYNVANETTYWSESTLKARGIKLNGNVEVGFNGVLDCPMTVLKDKKITGSNVHPEQLKALADVRNVAAEFICKNCEFAPLSRTASAERLVVLERLEGERLQEVKANIEARVELHELYPDTFPAPPEITQQ